MGLGRIFSAQGRFGPISFGPAQGLGHFWNLTFGPGPGLDFLALGWAGPWAKLKINVGPNLGHFHAKFRQLKTMFDKWCILDSNFQQFIDLILYLPLLGFRIVIDLYKIEEFCQF